MKKQGYFSLSRHRYRRPHLFSWWKVAIFFSSSSSVIPTLSSHLRPISCFSPIVVQAAFCSCPFYLGGRKVHCTTLFPATPTPEKMSLSFASKTGECSLRTASCPRRSSRISNRSCDAIIQRKGVRLFQGKSAGIENENETENTNDGSNLVTPDFSNDVDNVPATISRKRRATRSSSRSTDESDRKSVKQKKVKEVTAVSTPVRGSNAIPVTPEPVEVENSSGSARSPRKKTLEVNRKSKTRTKKVKTATKTKKKASRIVVTWPEPEGWRETYELVRELRKDKTAPCDLAGAEALALPPMGSDNNGDVGVDMDMDDEEYAKTSRFQTLIALMLSSQTKDAMVGQAMGNLRDTSDGSGGLTVSSILEMDSKVLNTKIYSVGFRNNKTKYIKQVAQILHDEYNGDIPPTAGEMIRDLPGVGPKMAYIVENICWNRQSGIGVDTHMQRLFPKLGWVSPDTKNPEQTRKQLESWLPQEYWGEVNLLWVGFGQEVQQEKQKILKKALLSDRTFDALCLLRAVDFDISSEWNKMQSVETTASDEDEKEGNIWKDDNEREKINRIIEEVLSK